jgi:hypothetical protein
VVAPRVISLLNPGVTKEKDDRPTTIQHVPKAQRDAGFTLVELLVAVTHRWCLSGDRHC